MVVHSRQPMEKAIFEAKDGSGTDDGRLWENVAYNLLTSSLPVVNTWLFRRLQYITGYCTLDRKNSEGEFLSAL